MARQGGVAVENNFVRALITETTGLKFPPNACTETYDCVFDSTGRVTRRLGIDFEPDYVLNTYTSETDEAFVEYQWSAVAGEGLLNFLVQQQGSTIRFFDVSTEGSVSANLKSFTLDLNDFVPDISNQDPASFACSFAQGNGKLLVANPVCDPFFVEYSPSDDLATGTAISLSVRDFIGLDDGLTLIERPTSTVADLKTNNPQHYYNLLNQTWHTAAGKGLSEWDTARSDLPSNADYVALYRASETDIFDNARVTENSPGNTPAPKGHFILDAANPARTDAMTDEGFTGASVDTSTALIHYSSGTKFGNSISVSGSFNNAFDGDTSQTQAEGAQSAMSGNICAYGKNWVVAPNVITHAIIYGSSNQGFVVGSNPTVTAQIRAKQGSAPSSITTDGTALGTIVFTDTTNESAGRTISSSDTTTLWDHTWLILTITSSEDWAIAEVEFYTTPPDLTQERPSCVEFFAGRAWYAGINADGLNSNIYFSQIIERNEQYGHCYQLNDPTSEDNAQLLPTDGGVVKIPEIGSVGRLFATQNSLLVFATNGVWLISGAAGAGFDATSYQVSRLSSIGTTNFLSFVDIQGLPFWWAESDIYTAQYDPNYNSYKIQPITTETIQTFIRNIPESSRKYIKGTHNIDTGLAAWIFNREDNPYTYTEAIIMDTASGALYPWTVSDNERCFIKGLCTVSVADASTEPRTMLTTTVDGTDLTYSASYQPTYLDWESFATLEADDSLAIDYESYFVTGYRLDGQAHRFFQSNYVLVYMDEEDEASCYMQGIFDFTNTPSSGKWSTSQQVYNSGQIFSDIRQSRLKVRGKGKSLQLKFRSATGKPFTIIGWVIWETSNAAI